MFYVLPYHIQSLYLTPPCYKSCYVPVQVMFPHKQRSRLNSCSPPLRPAVPLTSLAPSPRNSLTASYSSRRIGIQSVKPGAVLCSEWFPVRGKSHSGMPSNINHPRRLPVQVLGRPQVGHTPHSIRSYATSALVSNRAIICYSIYTHS